METPHERTPLAAISVDNRHYDDNDDNACIARPFSLVEGAVAGGSEGGVTKRDRRATLMVAIVVVATAVIATSALVRFVAWNKGGSAETIHRHHDTLRFPSDFVWGAATSAYQIEGAVAEGGRGATIWDTFCHPTASGGGIRQGHVFHNDTGDVSCDHYHLFRDDVRLMESLGLKSYRFSIAWSRIVPNGTGEINHDGVAFYDAVIDALLEHNIEPWVTLYHFDLPQSLQDAYGGWSSRRIVHDFAHYARICFELYGDRVQNWITINEGWTVAVNGYGVGIHAPGHVSDTEPYVVAHHVLLAHAAAAKIYRTDFQPAQKGVIGMANSGDYRYPRSPSSIEDRDAAERAMLFQIGWLCDPVSGNGDYPSVMRELLGDRLPQFTVEERKDVKGSADFIGLNHYSTLLASQPERVPNYRGYWADMNVEFSSDPNWKKNHMNWSVVPDGFLEMLKWIDERYNRPIIYVTENGSSEYEPDLKSALRDHGRRDYLEGYIRACGLAIDSGVDLRGYFIWSFMDNFEWQLGYSQRFGLCHVDFATQVRMPKMSALWYRDIIKANEISIQRNASSGTHGK